MTSCFWKVSALVMLLLLGAGWAFGHPGHGSSAPQKTWRDEAGRVLLYGHFALTKDGQAGIYQEDGKLSWVPVSALSVSDRDWIRARMEQVAGINAAPDAEANPLGEFDGMEALPVVGALLGLTFFAWGVVRMRKRLAVFPFAGATAGVLLVAFTAVAIEEGKKSAARKHFEVFKDKVRVREDAKYLYVESNGVPDHQMMVGIRAWQQQVPIPQPYSGENAWRIPLFPKQAENPVSAKTALFRGAIALAVNGVPIFNPIKNDGRTDTLLAGELDDFGGHCGRGDDYHYHIGPVHLEKVTGKGNPIGYALDGYPLYGFTDGKGVEPRDLDAFNGRQEMDGYKYYSTKKYPYINGGMRGEVTVREDQVDPQPRASGSVRPSLPPLRGARITGFTRDDKSKTYTLSYTLAGGVNRVRYNQNADGGWTFRFIDAGGKETVSTYSAKGPGGRGGGRGPGGGGRPKGEGKGDRPKGPDGPEGDLPPREDGKPMGEPGRQPWLAAHFDELDADKDGVLTTAEVKKEVEKTFAGFDANKDGKLTRDEYAGRGPGVRSALAGFIKGHSAEFSEKDGTITREGLEAFMLRMFDKADRGKTGKLTRAEAARTGPGQRQPRD